LSELVWLDAADTPPPASIGSKGATLCLMARAGLPVPPGFCIPADVLGTILATEQLRMLRYELSEALAVGAPLQRPVARMRAVLMAAPVPEAAWAAIREAAAKLRQRADGAPFAVRSSAMVEDQPGQSFAGQFQTFLGVNGDDQLLAAIRSCWSALFGDRALEYASEHGLGLERLGMGVIVQAMAPAEASGILHTQDAPAHPDQLLVEGAWGLGPGVAEGAIVPDVWRVDRSTLAVVDLRNGSKKQMATVDPYGGIAWQPVAGDRASQPCLSPERVQALARLGLHVEALRGGPQQVEWAVRGDDLWLLQTRALPEPRPLEVLETAPEIDWYAAWVARRLAPRLAPPPLPGQADWPAILEEALRPLSQLGLPIPSPEQVFRFQGGVAVALDPRWPVAENDEVPPRSPGADLPAELMPAAPLGARPDNASRLYDMAIRRGLLLPPELLAPWFESGSSVEGLTVSGERVVGRVRLVHEPEDLAAARPGEILVATYMRPTMTAVLGVIAGLVVEAGGSTSHVATIARERNLPALMSAIGATQRLRTGQLVLLDAPAGRCYYLAS
jgi:phosphoenolpyruvate synthase/pyruvate phosphate dikinase